MQLCEWLLNGKLSSLVPAPFGSSAGVVSRTTLYKLQDTPTRAHEKPEDRPILSLATY